MEHGRRDDDAELEVDLACVCALMCVVRTRERYQQIGCSPYMPSKNHKVCFSCNNMHV